MRDHRAFFASGRTRDLSFRREQLKRLKQAIIMNEQAMFDALKQDMNKPALEAYGGEIAIVINEINHVLKHLDSWARPRKFKTPYVLFPSTSQVIPEPYGLALIISPWNFPFQLTFMPLIGSIAAGTCTLLKPPPNVPHSLAVIRKIITDYFGTGYISMVEGGAETGQMLLDERFDYIFFTGGAATGRLVMQAAARHLTPLSLELGGKNPCIVDKDINVDRAARRIAWGKFFNAGQNCVSVDYLLVDRRIKQALLDRMAVYVAKFYGADAAHSADYARIVDDDHFDRLARLLKHGTIVVGGRTDRSSRYIEPTILDNVSGRDPIMEDEIFGPLLPVLEYDSLAEAIAFVNSRPSPLALYLFSSNKTKQDQVLRETSSGACFINDAILHETWPFPFGGVGESGMGKYHGKASFDTFSHYRSIMKNNFLFDLGLRFPPYTGKLKWLRKLF
jgi:aldehyde dehydrogenase (NAD+)